MTEYLRKISQIQQPEHHTIQWYWAQESIWRRIEPDFFCFQSEHFKKLLECLCAL